MGSPGTVATEEALAVLARYESAFNEHDAEAMNALFAEETTFVNFGGRLVVGRDALLAAQRFVFAPDGPLAEVTVTYRAEHVVALRSGGVLVHARQGDGPDPSGPAEAVFTALIEQEPDGVWRIRFGQNTPVSG